ncbi:hypothetical protein V2J09_011460 [Rumex salicifolius]
MGVKTKLIPIFFLVFSLFLSSALSLRLNSDDLINPSRDPHSQIRQQCQEREQGYHQIRRCMDDYETRGRRPSFDTDEDIPALSEEVVDISHRRDPQQEFQQCRRQCHIEESEPHRQMLCEESEYHRREPGQRFRECRRRCEQREQGGHQQRRCEERCEEQYERDQRQQRGSRERIEEEGEERRSPRQQLQECRRKCQRQEQGGRRCQERCQQRYDRQTGQGSPRVINDEDEDMDNPRGQDPEFQYQQCKSRCQRKPSHQQRECQKRCDERYEHQHESRTPHDTNNHHEDPKRQLEKCKSRCRALRWSTAMVHECEDECEDDFERRQRRQGRDNDDLDADNHHQEDPRRQLEDCKRICRAKRWATASVHRCEDKCEDDFERKQRHQERDGDLEDEMYPRLHEGKGTDRAEKKYEQCQRRCEREGRRQGQQWQCQRRCQEDFERERGEEGGRGRRPHHGGGSESMRDCRLRCEEQGYGYDCERRCSREYRGRRGDDVKSLASSVLAAFFG